MDKSRFDLITRSLASTPSRRAVLRGLAGAGLGIGSRKVPDAVTAKNKQKGKKNKKKDRKKQKTIFNQYGCLDVGQPCKGNSALCCSGICDGVAPKKGKKDTSRCVAHNDAGFCTAETDTCALGVEVQCTPNDKHLCVRTTGNAGFCADFTNGPGGEFFCRVCRRDTDCQAEFGAGAACVVYGRICALECAATGGTACLPPAV